MALESEVRSPTALRESEDLATSLQFSQVSRVSKNRCGAPRKRREGIAKELCAKRSRAVGAHHHWVRLFSLKDAKSAILVA